MTEDDKVQAILRTWGNAQADGEFAYGISRNKMLALASTAVEALTPQCGARHPQRPGSETIVCTAAAAHRSGLPVTPHRNAQFGLTWTDDWTTHDELGELLLIAWPDGEQMTEQCPLPGGVCDSDVDHDHDPGPERPQDWPTWGEDCPACLQHAMARVQLNVGPSPGTLVCPHCDGLFMDRAGRHGAIRAQSEPEPDPTDLARMLLTALLQTRKALGAVDQKYRSDSKAINASLVRQVRDAADVADGALQVMVLETGKECVTCPS